MPVLSKLRNAVEIGGIYVMWILILPIAFPVLVMSWRTEGYSWRESCRRAWIGPGQ